MATITYTSREEIEVHKFSALAIIGIPLLAIFFQAYLSSHLTFLKLFDIPLIVTVFCAFSRRNQLAGMLTGCSGRCRRYGAGKGRGQGSVSSVVWRRSSVAAK